MGKHSRREVGLVKKTAFASAATIGATAVLSNPAQAAEVVVPNTGMTFQVDGLENVPNINAVPGINQWVPSLAGQGQQVNYTAVAEGFAGNLRSGCPGSGPGAGHRWTLLHQIVPPTYGATGPNSFRLFWSDQLGLQAGWQGTFRVPPRLRQHQAPRFPATTCSW